MITLDGTDPLISLLGTTPDDPAFLGGSGTIRALLSRRELADMAGHIAGSLHHRGLRPGDTLALAVRPGPQALAVVAAALRLRLRIALVDPSVGPDVLTAHLAAAAPKLLVCDAVVRAAAGWAAPFARRAGIDLPPLRTIAPVVGVGRRGCGLLSGTRRPVPDWDGPDLDADALVIFTSGTTGRPRAVVHRVASLLAGLSAVTDLVAPQPHLPVVGSTFFVMAPALLAGAPVALPARRSSQLVHQLAALRPQATYLTPPQARDLLTHRPRLSGRFYSGSAPVSRDLLGRLRDAGAEQAWGVYAMTEAFPVAAVEAKDKRDYTGTGDLLGALLPGVTAAVDERGEVLLSGPVTHHRYLGESPTTVVHTGDRGRLVGGHLVLEGRMKDMILRDAHNIYPGLYEPALQIPGVELAVLVGIPAGDGDERVALLVQPRTGLREIDIRRALAKPLARMGAAAPDHVVFGTVPLSGRSRKPDRAAAARLVARRLAPA